MNQKYEEHHFDASKLQDVGIAFNHNRVWVCLDGAATLRAIVIDGKLHVEFNVPQYDSSLRKREEKEEREIAKFMSETMEATTEKQAMAAIKRWREKDEAD